MVSLSPTIGRVFGIPVQLHWTFLGLMLLAFVLLITASGGAFLFSLIILLFICVLIHEFAHSLTALRNGIKVKKIILLPIGGASVIDLNKVKPRLEFKIAIAGPIMSIILGIIFLPLYLLFPGGLIGQALQFLFEINLLLGVFNLLPGFPLDGGRVLRSYLQIKRSFIDATRVTVKASNAVIVLFIIGTVIYAAAIKNVTFSYREFIVLWDIIIALFLYEGARAELQSAEFKNSAADLRARDMMTRNFIFVSRNTGINALYREMVSRGTTLLLTRKGGKIYAMFGDVQKFKNYSNLSERGIMSLFKTEVPQIKESLKLSKALDIMQIDEVNVLAVTKGTKVTGVLYAPNIYAAMQIYLSKSKDQKNR
jgi:Zn-dependent protease